MNLKLYAQGSFTQNLSEGRNHQRPRRRIESDKTTVRHILVIIVRVVRIVRIVQVVRVVQIIQRF